MEIARGVGTPLQIDKATRERQFGYYARILVDIELSQDLPTSLMVEKGNHVFSVNISYENLPHHFKKQEKSRGRSRDDHAASSMGKKLRQEYRIKATLNIVSHTEVTEQPDTEIVSLENVHEVHQEPFVPLVDQNALVDSQSDEIIGPIDSTVAVLVCPSEPQLESIVTTRSACNIVNVTVSNNFEILGEMQE
uniref:uncharacterized protein LOC105351802 n=1 Tax=Fragaria vesca subsp. vesca TaxID=101020 RepID=UPI0005C9F45D|nr:PREDICTED: uncharacterized protein LOC105351802 [Fragaria vesca subsp. vesca]